MSWRSENHDAHFGGYTTTIANCNLPDRDLFWLGDQAVQSIDYDTDDFPNSLQFNTVLVIDADPGDQAHLTWHNDGSGQLPSGGICHVCVIQIPTDLVS